MGQHHDPGEDKNEQGETNRYSILIMQYSIRIHRQPISQHTWVKQAIPAR
jgi:hypothetical protein